MSKYLFIINDDGDCDDFATLWISNPKINKVGLIMKETVARIFPEIHVNTSIGTPCLFLIAAALVQ